MKNERDVIIKFISDNTKNINIISNFFAKKYYDTINKNRKKKDISK